MQVKEQVFSSASVDADVCAGRCGRLRRSMRTSAPVDTDICVGRCGRLRRSMRITIAIQKIPQQGTFTT
ncbi:hypothetical protein [Leyella stercorea]|uniref:hypothetical protein n=1 Tax=Leyella stercorea TaxID=363265 RepID=UPI00242E569A|nr:hypothetical protein [Leyella stercorea]